MGQRLLTAITPQLYLIVLSLIFSFNLADGLLTLLWVYMGIAEEANPVMSFFLDMGPFYFLSVKIFVVATLLYFIHGFYDVLLARALVLLVLLSYLFVIGIHMRLLVLIVTLNS